MTAPTKTKPAAKDSKGAKAADGEEEEGGGGGGKKKLLVIAVVALLAIGAALYFFVFSSSGEAEEVVEPEAGEVLVLDSVAVNLAGSGYLKVGVALQLTADAASGHGPMDGSHATDIVIDTFSQAQLADVTGNREALKAELEQRIEEAYNHDGTEVVMGIYFTEYVTQ